MGIVWKEVKSSYVNLLTHTAIIAAMDTITIQDLLEQAGCQEQGRIKFRKSYALGLAFDRIPERGFLQQSG